MWLKRPSIQTRPRWWSFRSRTTARSFSAPDLTIMSSLSWASHAIALRDDVHADLQQRVEQPVPTFAEQSLELAVAEVQTHLVAADLDSLEEHHWIALLSVPGLTYR